MRILWVKANKILPAHSGGDIRSWNIVRHLAQGEDVVFLSYYDGEPDPEYEAELKKRLPGAICVCTGKRADSKWARSVDYLRHLSDEAPYAVGRFASEAVRVEVWRCLQEENIDIVVSDFLDAAINVPDRMAVPAVLFQHNVESEIWRRHASHGSNLALRALYAREFRRMTRYEQQSVRRFARVIAVSEHDKRLMSMWTDGERITVVPTGVDIDEFAPGSPEREKPLVVFVGAMDWEPNADAVKYFCAEMWPSIRGRVPQAKFRIVGRNPDVRVKALASESVEVTGRVPSVVEHLREAAVVVVPLRVGGGTRLKIYEAMAAGKAVVSTGVGAEGLDVEDGRDIRLAYSPQGFADAVVALLGDREARRRMGSAGAEKARRYSWPAIAEKFAEVLSAVVEKHASRPARALTVP